jgi:hypothetical protein
MVPRPVLGFYILPNFLNNPRGLVPRNNGVVEPPFPGVKPLFQGADSAVGRPYQDISRPGRRPGGFLHHHAPRFIQESRFHIRVSMKSSMLKVNPMLSSSFRPENLSRKNMAE